MLVKTTKFKNISLIVCTLLASACATVEKINLSPENKQRATRIAVVQTPEQERYTMAPAPNVAGAGLYMFCALGGLVLAGIENVRFENATKPFDAAVSPLKPELNKLFFSQLHRGLVAKGYAITPVAMPAGDVSASNPALNTITGEFDSILFIKPNAGYRDDGGSVSAVGTANLSFKLKGQPEQIMNDTVVASMNNNVRQSSITWLDNSQTKYVFPSQEAAVQRAPEALEGLKEVMILMVNRLLDNF